MNKTLKTIEYDKNNKNAYLNLSAYWAEKEEYTKAKRYIRSAWELDKTSFETIYKYGIILFKAQETHRAKEKFEEAIKLSPDDLNCNMALAQCLLKLGKAQKALEITEKFKIDDKSEFLMIKLLALSEISTKNPENMEIKNTILEICDKIQTDQKEIVEQIKQIHSK